MGAYSLDNSELNSGNEELVHELFEEVAHRNPNDIAVFDGDKSITYGELNKKANQIANLLQKNKLKENDVVGVLLERSIEMIVSIISVLKASGTFLIIEPDLPVEYIQNILDYAEVKLLITNSKSSEKIGYEVLQSGYNTDLKVHKTPLREPIADLDSLPMPDRSHIDLTKYSNRISMSSVTKCIPLQSTRGCPFYCLYCHKIWSKKHYYRSAENIFNEIEFYYKQGVRNFSFVDDIFNLNKENSGRLFRLLLKSKINVKIFFPNGLRGDALPRDYIDLMVEAGTTLFNLSLETASPRLQKLLQKNINIERFKEAIDYIALNYPSVGLELNTMHGFPTETEEEAMMTLNFIKNVKWVHFAFVHILKIFPNTDMEKFALENGVTKEAIQVSSNYAFHELPETLPFPKNFTRNYQSMFMNEYVLLKERIKHVLPAQMKIATEEALVQRYNAYLPTDINKLEDILDFAHITDFKIDRTAFNDTNISVGSIFDIPKKKKMVSSRGKRLLLLDLSLYFSPYKMLYKVVEQPLGQLYLLTYIKEKFGDKIDGRIYKSGVDFDSFNELKVLIDEYKPDLIGIRTLTYFKNFFHETIALIREWGYSGQIITGGPYATSDYKSILNDSNIDLVLIGEGEETIVELLQWMLENDFKIPSVEKLAEINGIVYRETPSKQNRKIINWDRDYEQFETMSDKSPVTRIGLSQKAYLDYSSDRLFASEQWKLTKSLKLMMEYFSFTNEATILQRTHKDFIWQVLLALITGSKIKILSHKQSGDPEEIIKLLLPGNPYYLVSCSTKAAYGMLDILSKLNHVIEIPWLIIVGNGFDEDKISALNNFIKGNIVCSYNIIGSPFNNIYSDLKQINKRLYSNYSNSMFILSEDGQAAPLDVSGRVFVAEDGFKIKMIGQKSSAQIPAKLEKYSETLFDTGVIGKWNSSGELEIIGQSDRFITVGEYYINSAIIESVIESHPYVSKCFVLLKNVNINGNDTEALCVFYEGPGAEKDKENELKEYLKLKLPQYEIPEVFINIETIRNHIYGEINLKSLYELDLDNIVTNKRPENQIEEQLLKVWSNILQQDQNSISINDSFFDLGGDSFRMAVFLSRFINEFLHFEGEEISQLPQFDDLLQNPTIERFAAYAQNFLQD